MIFSFSFALFHQMKPKLMKSQDLRITSLLNLLADVFRVFERYPESLTADSYKVLLQLANMKNYRISNKKVKELREIKR